MSHILIIDDDDSFRTMLKELLGDLGHTVTEASDGAEAVDIYRAGRFDLILTDILMPGREGIETIQSLRLLNHDIRIIAMSGGGQIGPEDYLSMACQLGARCALVKPFQSEQLRAAIAEALKT